MSVTITTLSDGISGNTVLAFDSSRGDLWLVMPQTSISYRSFARMPTSNPTIVYEPALGLAANNTYPMAIDSLGRYLFFTNGTVIIRHDLPAITASDTLFAPESCTSVAVDGFDYMYYTAGVPNETLRISLINGASRETVVLPNKRLEFACPTFDGYTIYPYDISANTISVYDYNTQVDTIIFSYGGPLVSKQVIATDRYKNALIVDPSNHVVLAYTYDTNTLVPYAGTSGVSGSTSTTFDNPHTITVDYSGSNAYVIDDSRISYFSLSPLVPSAPAPSNFEVVNIGTTNFTLSWSPVDHADFYTVTYNGNTISTQSSNITLNVSYGTQVQTNVYATYPLSLLSGDLTPTLTFTVPSRFFPVPTPPPQKIPICGDKYPIPTSQKRPVYTFNFREFWSLGANRVGRNCVQGDTLMTPSQ